MNLVLSNVTSYLGLREIEGSLPEDIRYYIHDDIFNECYAEIIFIGDGKSLEDNEIILKCF